MAKIFDYIEGSTVVFYGARLAAARRDIDTTQERLAWLLITAGLENIGSRKVSQRTIARMEGEGQGFITADEAKMFEKVLGIEGD